MSVCLKPGNATFNDTREAVRMLCSANMMLSTEPVPPYGDSVHGVMILQNAFAERWRHSQSSL